MVWGVLRYIFPGVHRGTRGHGIWVQGYENSNPCGSLHRLVTPVLGSLWCRGQDHTPHAENAHPGTVWQLVWSCVASMSLTQLQLSCGTVFTKNSKKWHHFCALHLLYSYKWVCNLKSSIILLLGIVRNLSINTASWCAWWTLLCMFPSEM